MLSVGRKFLRPTFKPLFKGKFHGNPKNRQKCQNWRIHHSEAGANPVEHSRRGNDQALSPTTYQQTLEKVSVLS